MTETKKQNKWIFVVIAGVVVLAVVLGIIRTKNGEQAEPLDTPKSSTEVADSGEKRLSLSSIVKSAQGWEEAYKGWKGKKAPDFSLVDLEGKTHKLSDYSGKNVVLVFWATWCMPCRMEIPHLKALKKIMGDEVEILAISDEEKAVVEEFVKAEGIDYTVLLSEGRLGEPYSEVRNIPSSFFIDKEGNIKLGTVGSVHLGALKAIVLAK